MTVGEQARWWGLAALLLILFMWAFAGPVTPFLVGMAVAYFLDPIADRLERLGFSRLMATTVIMGGAVLIGVSALLFVVPMLADQLVRLVKAIPGYVEMLRDLSEGLNARFADTAMADSDFIARAIDNAVAAMESKVAGVVESLFAGGLALLNFVALIVIVPVVAFYLLLDWDRMVDEIDHWLPRRHAPTIRRLAADVDNVLSSFVRGQFSVCLILGVFYALALALIGLDFGMIVGLFAGLISFIPFVGSLLGGTLSIGIALAQFWFGPAAAGEATSVASIVAVAAVFLLGQAVEGNYLTPRLVGGSVGLHPVWLMFALAAFGAAFGFVGLLVAVPVSASIGVFARFVLEQYKAGRLYAGGEPLTPDDPDHERDGQHAETPAE